MKKFIILIPLFNDWKSVSKLLSEIDFQTSSWEESVSVIIVNDASTEKRSGLEFNFKKIKLIKILNMKENIIEIDSNNIYENGEYVVNNKGFMYKEGDKYKNGKFIIKFSVCNKYLELNSEYKEDENFKELINKYF